MNSPATQRVGVKWFEAALWLAALLLLSLGIIRLTHPRTPPEPVPLQRSGNLVYAYDVRDIADAMITAAKPRYPGAINPPPQGWGGVIFTGRMPPGPPPTPESVAIEQLARVIEEACSLSDWVDYGGTVATMQPGPGWLIISDTALGHAQVQQFLRVYRQQLSARIHGVR